MQSGFLIYKGPCYPCLITFAVSVLSVERQLVKLLQRPVSKLREIFFSEKNFNSSLKTDATRLTDSNVSQPGAIHVRTEHPKIHVVST